MNIPAASPLAINEQANPEMLEALRLAKELISIARARFPKSIKHRDTFALELTSAAISTALHKATPPQA